VQAPGDVARGALQVLLALAPAHLLSLLYEGMVRGTHPLQEKVMPIQELAIPLQEVHGYGQHAPQDVGKPVSQLHTHTPCQSPLARQHSLDLPQLVQMWQNRKTEMLDSDARCCGEPPMRTGQSPNNDDNNNKPSPALDELDTCMTKFE